MNQKGLLSSWNDAKGFGFITPENEGKRLFAHISAYQGRGRPSAGDKVVYAQTKDEKGRLRAASFQYAGVVRHRAALATGVWVALLIAAAVGGAISVLYILGYVPLLLPVAYGAMSLVTFLMYAVDKGAAERGNRRVPEGRLHLFELLCGWPGALVGQQFFRHKTRKTSFQAAFWFNVILNLAVLGWLLVWPDAEFARQALEIKPVMLLRI
ncbi:DUF1294 domain-containing protein [Marinobacter sp. F4216]|uniref:DUF1294 domain-containing protein n=1 Tax=Marinobacter sp. F4216 TaxID=2874281 RepID=UPI001CBC9D64|nr:cold shock and DUF1294 domain-containing protein [Marinobacter sp. F4216]MBZ2168784.1 cold shock and DUF1294 domain-containing protein [Marinobacter sp. F4216]